MKNTGESFEDEKRLFDRIKREEGREQESPSSEKPIERPRDSGKLIKEKIADMKVILSKKVGKITDLYNLWQHTNSMLQKIRVSLGVSGSDDGNIQKELEQEFEQAKSVQEQLRVLTKYQAILIEKLDEFLNDLALKMLEEVKREWGGKIELWYRQVKLGKKELFNDGSAFFLVWPHVSLEQKERIGTEIAKGSTGLQVITQYYELFKTGIEREAERLAIRRYNAEVGEGLLDRLISQMQKLLKDQEKKYAISGPS